MSLATHSPLPDAIMQVFAESEQNVSVSCLNHLPLSFADNRQIQDTGMGLLANPQNMLITGGTFVLVNPSCGLYKQLIILHLEDSIFKGTVISRVRDQGDDSLTFKDLFM